jgi:hypothetical protein
MDVWSGRGSMWPGEQLMLPLLHVPAMHVMSICVATPVGVRTAAYAAALQHMHPTADCVGCSQVHGVEVCMLLFRCLWAVNGTGDRGRKGEGAGGSGVGGRVCLAHTGAMLWYSLSPLLAA